MQLIIVSVILFLNLWSGFSQEENSTFLYYAYGSNLLSKRIHVNNPSAEFVDIGLLKDYRLDFNMQVDYWQGAVSTIVKDNSTHVWGALWRLNLTDMKNLDRQEGVDAGWYYATNVTVTAHNGTQYDARTYIETAVPDDDLRLPLHRQPSSSYLLVILMGAIESKLPAEYISSLVRFPTNGKLAHDKIRKHLEYPFY